MFWLNSCCHPSVTFVRSNVVRRPSRISVIPKESLFTQLSPWSMHLVNYIFILYISTVWESAKSWIMTLMKWILIFVVKPTANLCSQSGLLRVSWSLKYNFAKSIPSLKICFWIFVWASILLQSFRGILHLCGEEVVSWVEYVCNVATFSYPLEIVLFSATLVVTD